MPATLDKPARIGRPPIEDERPYLSSKALEAYAKTGSKAQAARAAGITRNTVYQILKRNPEAYLHAQKNIATGALVNSAMFTEAVTPSKVKKLNALQMVIGAKVAGQHALEMLGSAPAAVVINVAVLERAGDTAGMLRDLVARLGSKTVNVTPSACHTTTGSVVADKLPSVSKYSDL